MSVDQSLRASGPDREEPDGRLDPFDRIAEAFADRCRRGDSPSISEYEALYPDHLEAIRSLLPTVALMEQLKRGRRPIRQAEASWPIPERLGEFRVIRELGRGGMGVVYEAVQESLGRHVAVKVIHQVNLEAKRLDRFEREAQVIAQLHHTNIVPIFAVGEHEGLPYYAMQYIRGTGLDSRLVAWRAGTTPADAERWRFVARVGIQAGQALHYAHEQGILHRDVKPANLLIDEHESIWISDFGLAKLSGRDDLTAPGDVIGTLRYLAPEALRGEADHRGDVYSLGLSLYELLTLVPPFGAASQTELFRCVSEGEPTRPRLLLATIPRDLETIVLKAIARDPADRYQAAAALADDLRRFLEDQPILARRAALPERAWRLCRRNRAIAGLTMVAASSLLLAAIVGWVGYARTTDALDREALRRDQAEKATRRAEENVSLSLEVLSELFDKLDAADRFLPPPPPGRGSPRHGHPGSPPSAGPPGRDPSVAPTDKSAPGPPPSPPRPASREGAEADSALLGSVLTFYDRFAGRNPTNPTLQGDAAWAYCKVGVLYQRLDRQGDAERAFGRAIEMLEELVAAYPDRDDFRYKLVETYATVDPETVPAAALPSIEWRLGRASTLVDGLAARSPEGYNLGRARVFVHSKYGSVLRRLERLDEAEVAYRESIKLADAFLARQGRSSRVRVELISSRVALARLLARRGEVDESRSNLDAALATLGDLSNSGFLMSRDVAWFDTLADLYATLGDPDRADVVRKLAEPALRRGDPMPPPPRGRPRLPATGP